jgi:phage terminase large subunit-like protein
MRRFFAVLLLLVMLIAEAPVFSEKHAAWAVKFFESLVHTDGEFYNQPFVLLPWQKQIIRDVYGTLKPDGTRQYQYVYLEIPKKNGKSELAAGAALYHTFADREMKGEIYGCAVDRGQADIVYQVARDMVELHPVLSKRAKITDSGKQIYDPKTKSLYKVLSADAFRKHGFKVSACIFDELHAQPNRKLWDVMTFEAGASRKQPIWWIITTAGEDPDRVSICWEQHEYALQVLAARNGTGDPAADDPIWYPVIFGYDGEDIYNEANWFKANPSLGTAKSLESMRDAARTAKKKPENERLFRWLDLNQWITTKLTTWLPLELFDKTIGSWNRADLLGKDCFLGMDLSSTTDLTAICALFPPQGTQYDWRAFWHCWIPGDALQERVEKDHVPYDKWAEAGHVTVTEGDVVDYTKVEATILEIKKFYNVIELPADRAFAAMLLQRLEQQQMLCVDVPQTFKVLTSPMNLIQVLLKIAAKQQDDDLEQLKADLAQALGMPALNAVLLRGGLTHENSQVARWCFGNASKATNGNAEIKLVKEHKGRSVDRTKRIDLMTALVNAMARAQFYQPKVDLTAAIMSDDFGF